MNEAPQKTTPAETGKTPAESSSARANPWRSLMELRRDMDRMFEDVSTRFSGSHFLPSAWTAEPFHLFAGGKIEPAIDIVETEKAYTVTAEVPGMAESDVDVSVSGETLTIKGEKQEETHSETDETRVSERRYGTLMRAIRLPEDVDPDKIEAAYAKGVLTLTLPKRPEAVSKPKKITVKRG